jgi:effector-binding domain-containing protein
MASVLRALPRIWAMAFLLAFCVTAATAQTETAKPSLPPDDFGTEVTLPEKTIVFLSGNAKWDQAFDTLLDALKTVYAYLDREGVKPAGDAMVIYTSADDAGFDFKAAVPIADALKNPPRGDLAVGPAPTGKAYRFVHRGAYGAMDATYETITNFLDEKGIDVKDMFIEEYVTDPRATPEDKLVINIYVPVR